MINHVHYLNDLLLKMDMIIPVITGGTVESEFHNYYPDDPDNNLFNIMDVIDEFNNVQEDLSGNVFQMSMVSQLCTKFLMEYHATLKTYAEIGTNRTDQILSMTDQMIKSINDEETLDGIYDKILEIIKQV